MFEKEIRKYYGIKQKDKEDDNKIVKCNKELIHAYLGLSGEVGEMIEIIKKHIYYGKIIDENHLKEELGDVLHYLSRIIDLSGFTLDEIMKNNLSKLDKRYPGQRDSDKDIKKEYDFCTNDICLSCNSDCCQDIGLYFSPDELKEKYIKSLLSNEKHGLNDFRFAFEILEFIKKDNIHPAKNKKDTRDVYHYKCKVFDKENRKCLIYDKRPHMCKIFDPIKDCGYACKPEIKNKEELIIKNDDQEELIEKNEDSNEDEFKFDIYKYSVKIGSEKFVIPVNSKNINGEITLHVDDLINEQKKLALEFLEVVEKIDIHKFNYIINVSGLKAKVICENLEIDTMLFTNLRRGESRLSTCFLYSFCSYMRGYLIKSIHEFENKTANEVI